MNTTDRFVAAVCFLASLAAAAGYHRVTERLVRVAADELAALPPVLTPGEKVEAPAAGMRWLLLC